MIIHLNGFSMCFCRKAVLEELTAGEVGLKVERNQKGHFVLPKSRQKIVNPSVNLLAIPCASRNFYCEKLMFES